MTLVAHLAVEDTPLERIAENVRRAYASSRSAADSPLTVHVAGIDARADDLPLDGARPALLWQLDAARIRIGPLLGGGDACLRCLSSWIDHNRPEPAAWRALPPAAPDAAAFAWPPVVYRLIEAVSVAHAEDLAGRTVIDIDPRTLAVERHAYLPAPDCPRCTPRPPDERRFGEAALLPVPKPAPDAFRARGVAAEVDALRAAFADYRTGLVCHMYRDATSTMLPMWGAETRLPGHAETEIGFGRHARARTAEGVAILEALERFCSQSPRSRQPAVRGSLRSLRAAGLPALDPERFILCDAAQRSEPGYGLVPYAPDLEHDWIWAFSFAQRGPVLVSLQLAFYDGRVPKAERFLIETSNGCALGGSFAEAAFHGLLEVVERDAYMTRWHVQGAPRRIELADPALPNVHGLHARALAEGLELHAFAIGVEVAVPTVLAMIVDPRADAPVKSYCASGAHPNAEAALFGALVEVCSSLGVYQRQFGSEHDRARAMLHDGSLVRTMRDHVVLYAIDEALPRLAFLDRQRPAVTTAALYGEMEARWRGADLLDDLEQLVRDVRAVADDVVVVDQRSNVLDPFGLHCVKVLAPGLHPVTFGHQYRRISDARLAGARARLRAAGEDARDGRSAYPHNFP